jgi:hypothetical protein
MNTVVFSILRLCPPVPLCGGSSRYQLADYSAVGGHLREFPVPWAAGMGRAPCHSWSSVALGKPRGGRRLAARRRQPGLHRRARARQRRRTLLRPVASLRPRSLAWSSPTRPQNPNAVDVETRELRRPGARSPVIYLCFVLNSPALVLFRLLQNPNWLSALAACKTLGMPSNKELDVGIDVLRRRA